MVIAFVAGAVTFEGAEILYDALRPMTAPQAVLVSAVVRVAAQQRNISEREMWSELQKEKGFRSPQQMTWRAARTLIYEVGAAIDPMGRGLF